MQGKCSKASDCYAFGITLWEMYTGEEPFKGVLSETVGHLHTHIECNWLKTLLCLSLIR